MRYSFGVPSFAKHTDRDYILYLLSWLTGFTDRINDPTQLLCLLFLREFFLVRFVFGFFVLFRGLNLDRLLFRFGLIQDTAVNLQCPIRLA